MSGGRLAGRQLAVVGASAGVGAATTIAAADAGATVLAAARDIDRIAVLADRVGGSGSIVALRCDVADEASVDAFADAVAATLGADRLDALVVTAGITHLSPMAGLDAAAFRRVLDTNLVGPHLVLRALTPLVAAGGRVGCCSSNAVAAPMPGLGAYVASKAGLDLAVEAWREERPDLGVTRIVVGPTVTDAAASWDPALSAAYFERWFAEGHFDGIEPVAPEVVAAALVDWLVAPEAPVVLDLFSMLNRTG